MKVLKAGVDFKHTSDIEPREGDKFLIKSCIASGWARLVKVIRTTKTQVEVEIINVIPTEESNKFGTRNGLFDNRDRGDFFLNWNTSKKMNVGRKRKFFKDSCIEVGCTNQWNPSMLIKLI